MRRSFIYLYNIIKSGAAHLRRPFMYQRFWPLSFCCIAVCAAALIWRYMLIGGRYGDGTNER